VKRLILLAVGIFGLRMLLQRRRTQAALDSAPSADDLRAKLDESRATEATATVEPIAVEEPPPAPEPVAEEPKPEPAAKKKPAARRKEVHARAREAMDELSS
jgi:hypothetical protein